MTARVEDANEELDKKKELEKVADELYDEEDRGVDDEQWASRMSFILAAVGSAIGLGNFWRFPYYAFNYGGVFLIPYFFALFTVGIPLMQLEMAVGQVFRRACAQAFGKLDSRFRGVGLAAGMVSFMVVCYYQLLLAWGNVFFINAFRSEGMPWDINGLNGTAALAKPASFFSSVVQDTGPSTFGITYFIWDILIGAGFQWICVLLILLFGAEFISKAVWVTVLLPVVMLFVLIITGATLEGASLGIEAYIGNWDFSALKDGDIWTTAFGQIFFSLGVGFGVMPAYGAMNPRNSDIVKDAVIVSLLNCGFSFMAGFAVFTVAGYFASEAGFSFDDPSFRGTLGGPGLAFIAYPAGLSMIGGAGARFFCAMFFVTFFFLGIDSAFSLVEAVVMNFRETKAFARFTKQQFTIMVCCAGSIWTVFYCTDKGTHYLEVVDQYAGTLGLFLVAFLEIFVSGWVFKHEELVEKVGKTPVMVFELGFWAGVFIFTYLSLGLGLTDVDTPLVIGVSSAIGIVICGASMVISLKMAQSSLGVDAGEAAKTLFLHGPIRLKDYINEVVTENDSNGNWKFSIAWCILLKFFMGPCVFFLMNNKLFSLIGNGGVIEGGASVGSAYIAGYQVLGVFALVVAVALILFGFVFPKWYEEPKRASAVTNLI